MDHHCVWINRCVGYYNYKAFFIFIFFLAQGTMLYVYLLLDYIIARTYKFELEGPAWYFSPLFWTESVIVCLTAVLVPMLFGTHLMLIITNVSTIEYMQGKPHQLPCCTNNLGVTASQVNVHDMGIVPNFIQIFGINPLMWFVPTKVNQPAHGEFWPRVPELGHRDFEAARASRQASSLSYV
jgi:palmitoyltransferase